MSHREIPVPLLLELLEPESVELFADFDGPDTASWIKFDEGIGNPVDTVTSNVANAQTGDWVTVTIDGNVHDGIQYDGATEFTRFPADSDYLTGITTRGTIDIIVRIDTYANGDAIVAISDDNFTNDDNDSFLIRTGNTDTVAGFLREAGAAVFTNGGSVSNGDIVHVRQSWDTTSGTQLLSLFIDDMSSTVDTTPTALDSVIQNAGTTQPTFGALDSGGANAAVTIIEFMIRDNVHTDQLSAFS